MRYYYYRRPNANLTVIITFFVQNADSWAEKGLLQYDTLEDDESPPCSQFDTGGDLDDLPPDGSLNVLSDSDQGI